MSAPPPGFHEEEEDNDEVARLAARVKAMAAPPGFDDEKAKQVVVGPPPGLVLPPPGLFVLQKYSSSSEEQKDAGGAPPPPPLPPVSTEAQELRDFLAWKDAPGGKLADQAELLLQMYSIHDVAEAVRDRFGMLPMGWRERGFTQSNQIRLRCNTTTTTTVADDSDVVVMAKVDRKINEIIDTEKHFLTSLLELQSKYLDRMYEIYGSGNADAVRNLGLSQSEATQIFEQLPHICRFSQQLLHRLALVDLVRKPPSTGEGRVVHVAKALLEMAPKLHAYAPAIMSYQQSLTILKDAASRLQNPTMTLSPTSSSAANRMDFIKLWERCTQNNEVLHHHQLIDVLITPMQRIPRYKMLLESLAKEPEGAQCAPLLDALELYSSAAKSMNEALRSHEKLKGFFGEELKPLSSTGGTESASSASSVGVKIINQYTHRFLGH